MNKVFPFLWFNDNGGEAMEFYKSVFKDDYKELSKQMMPDGKIMTFGFSIKGQEIQGMNAGPEFKFTEAISFFIDCKGQEEVDYYWNALIADGGEESQCGWLKDKFGLSWQVIPEELGVCMSNPDPVKSKKAMDAMMQMHKIIVADLEKAVE